MSHGYIASLTNAVYMKHATRHMVILPLTLYMLIWKCYGLVIPLKTSIFIILVPFSLHINQNAASHNSTLCLGYINRVHGIGIA